MDAQDMLRLEEDIRVRVNPNSGPNPNHDPDAKCCMSLPSTSYQLHLLTLSLGPVPYGAVP